MKKIWMLLSILVWVAGVNAQEKFYIYPQQANPIEMNVNEVDSFTFSMHQDTVYIWTNNTCISYAIAELDSIALPIMEKTLPAVTTDSVSQITRESAVCGGNITSTGYDELWIYGVCWDTDPNPTIYKMHTYDGSEPGHYTSTMTNLIRNTKYYVRAYVTNSKGTSYGEEYSFFTLQDSIPGEMEYGIFTVGPNKRVRFSRGSIVGDSLLKLTYQPSSQCGLYGWGTSGYNGKLLSMHDTIDSNYVRGISNISGTDYDWGYYNKIIGGGNVNHVWRVLTIEEWEYLLQTRAGASNKYGCGKIHNLCGLIILPDDWNNTAGVSFTPQASSWATNSYTSAEWEAMEAKGAVFLIASGIRDGEIESEGGYAGYYWTGNASATSDDYAYSFYFREGNNYTIALPTRKHKGCAVRLVRDY
ncbi:MAG: hypothetical protein II945_05415 [Bacteroidales bacterium]|nr:hypothetical protein [Bacteroidales bacterium]